MGIDSGNIVETIERVGGWLAAAGGVAIAARKRLTAIVRAIILADDFRTRFGPEAAATIRELLDDVTRSQTVQQLRQRIAERHLRVGVYVCGPDGRCNWSNEWLAEAFGIDRANMHGYGWLNSIATNERMQSIERWKYAVANGTPYSDEYTIENVRTSKTWRAQTEAFAIEQDGRVVCYVGYVIQKRTPDDSDLTHA